LPAQGPTIPPPKDQQAAEISQDPIASGSVLLNPSNQQDAKTIQSRLAELGFYKGAIDGMWGKGSQTSLKAFKEKNSLKNPNTWDKETQMALFAKTSQAGQPAAETGQDPVASGSVLLNPSNQQDAKTIQSRLAELGFYKGAIDGMWGKGSQTSLKAFKEKNSLKNPNTWDKETQMLLFKEISK
jgi:peptidoglycan hydrolase-like protein with peptidoglycan-binding domain